MQYREDLRNMGVLVADESVDVAFDKSTLDTMIYGSPWNSLDDVRENTGKYLAEVGEPKAYARASFAASHFASRTL